MKISEEALDEFIRIYKDECGEELCRSEASETASRLVTLYEVLAQKLPEEKGGALLTPPDDAPPSEPMGFVQ